MDSDEISLVLPLKGILTKEQELSGAPLTLDQIETSKQYFRGRGQLIDPNVTDNDGDLRALSSQRSPNVNYIVGQKVCNHNCCENNKKGKNNN